MGERIELPMTPAGTPEEQLRQMYSYLYRVAEALNHNLSEIGNMDLTDDERLVVDTLTSGEAGAENTFDWQQKESLKSLIIKTASFVQNKLNEYRINLLGEYVAEGKFGRYVRNTGLQVDITPTGIQQNFTFEEVVQGLQTYAINAKNYIKTGLLRTVQGLPVYGVAIGKDVVTFATDGTETYNDGNKVAELTADELSFYQNSQKVASYTGSGLTFYVGGVAKLTVDSNGVTVLNGTTKLAELLSSALKLYHNGELRTQTDSTGTYFYKGSTLLAEMTSSALKFYHNGEVRAQTDGTGITFYKGSTTLAEIKNGALKFYYNGSLRAQMDTNGVSMWNGSTKQSEFLSNALKFYTGGRISFYNGNTEVMYIENNKINVAKDFAVLSGGSFDVTATNFSISSTDKKVKTGSWEITENGMIDTWVQAGTNRKALFTTGNEFNTYINSTEGKAANVIFYNATPFADGRGIVIFGTSKANSEYVDMQLPIGFEKTETPPNILLGSAASDSQSRLFIYAQRVLPQMSDPDGYYSYLGASDNKWKYAYIDTLYQGSSRDIKHDIQPMPEQGEIIDGLEPVTFVYDDDAEQKKRYGLIYEDTVNVLPDICSLDEGGKAINYLELVPMLLKEIQDLRRRVDELERRE